MKLTLERRARRFVTVDGEALLKVGASSVLAVDEAAVVGGTTLLAEAPKDEDVQNTIAVVRVEGPLAQRAVSDLCGYVDGYDAITARFGAALAVKEAASVLLVIDSPGGDVAGLEEAVARMLAMKEQAGKPVVAYIDELCASAAYWIAAAIADEVHVPTAGRVGSIGCIGAWVDQSKAYEQRGIAWHVVRDPAGKAEMMPAAPVAELAEKRLGELVRSTSARFREAIASARGLDAKRVGATNAALFTGASAVAEGLADTVGTLEGAAGRSLELVQQRRSERHAKDQRMKLANMVGLLCGLASGATPEAAEKALDEQSTDLLKSTGAKTLAEVAARFEKQELELEAFREKERARAKADADAAAVKAKADADAKAAKLVSTVDAAVAAGKIRPVKRDEILAKAEKRGQEWLDDLVAELPVQGGSLEDAANAGADTTKAKTDLAIDDALRAELKKVGMTEDEYRRTKADMQAQGLS